MVEDERVEQNDEAGHLTAERRRVREHQTVVDVINHVQTTGEVNKDRHKEGPGLQYQGLTSLEALRCATEISRATADNIRTFQGPGLECSGPGLQCHVDKGKYSRHWKNTATRLGCGDVTIERSNVDVINVHRYLLMLLPHRLDIGV